MLHQRTDHVIIPVARVKERQSAGVHGVIEQNSLQCREEVNERDTEGRDKCIAVTIDPPLDVIPVNLIPVQVCPAHLRFHLRVSVTAGCGGLIGKINGIQMDI